MRSKTDIRSNYRIQTNLTGTRFVIQEISETGDWVTLGTNQIDDIETAREYLENIVNDLYNAQPGAWIPVQFQESDLDLDDKVLNHPIVRFFLTQCRIVRNPELEKYSFQWFSDDEQWDSLRVWDKNLRSLSAAIRRMRETILEKCDENVSTWSSVV